MVERPILFSGAMVRAILDGRKTQTRRVVKHENASEIDCWAHAGCGEWEAGSYVEGSTAGMGMMRCPFGRPGDRLWVRETWCFAHPDYHDEAEGLRLGRPMRDGRWCHYAASDDVDFGDKSAWRPSIHMPRWASRLMLEVTGVRVERLNDIREEDAKAEGVEAVNGHPERGAFLGIGPCHREGFAQIWADLNGADSWKANPWVWAIAFKRVTP